MSNETRVIRLRPDGDPETGMTSCELPSEDVTGSNPEERVHRFFVTKRDSMSEMRVGVYEGSAYTERVVDYPCDEMSFVLEGSVTIIDEAGHDEVFEKETVFSCPKVSPDSGSKAIISRNFT